MPERAWPSDAPEDNKTESDTSPVPKESAEASRRHDVLPSLMRTVSRGPSERWLQRRAEWMVREVGVQEFCAPKIQYADRLAGNVERGVTFLCIGAGKGHEMDEIDAVLPGSRVIGLDPHDYYSAPVQRRQRKLAHDARYLPESARAEHMEGVADASVDGASLFFVLHHIDEKLHGRILDELHRVIAPGGHVFVAEDLIGDEHERRVTERADRVLNWEIRDDRPHVYHDIQDWERAFHAHGFRMIRAHEVKPSEVRHGFFVFVREETQPIESHSE